MYCPDCGKEMSEIMGMRPPNPERQVMGDFCAVCLIYIEKEEGSNESRKTSGATKRPAE